MSISNTSWDQLRANVKNCCFFDCPRNQGKLRILFEREQDSLEKIEYLVLSQEPAASLKKYSDSDCIEKFLIWECSSNPTPTKGGLPAKIREIFNKKFDPTRDAIYWTHALKCVPSSDEDIRKKWKKCAPMCMSHFEKEVTVIPSKRLTIIAIGNYALAVCRHLFEGKPLSNTKGIMKYIGTMIPEQKGRFRKDEILLFPFVHPSHREQVLERWDKMGTVRRREKKFVKRIRQMDARATSA